MLALELLPQKKRQGAVFAYILPVYSVDCYVPSQTILYLIVLAEIIIKIIIEVIFKIFQIIWCKEAIYSICDRRNCRYCPDDSQYPDHCIFLFVILIPVEKLTQF